MNRICLGIALLVFAAGADAADDNPFGGLPHVHFAYYDVHGVTVDAIKRSIAENGPRDQNDLFKVASRSDWYVEYLWANGPDGKCDPTQASARFEAFVIMPRLVSYVRPHLSAKWKKFLSRLRQHEANHLRYAFDHTPDLVAAIHKAPSCEGAARVLAPVATAIRDHDVEYDKVTDHGRTEGAVFE